MFMGLLDGKVAIVTGAGRGIGRGHALELARQGAKVIVNDLGGDWAGAGADSTPAGQVVQEIKDLGGEGAPNFDNVATWDGAEKMVTQAIEGFGDLHILINNAGILRDRMTFNMNEDDWDAVVTVHGKGHFAPTRHACAYWRQKSKDTGGPVFGRVIHTSSESGLFSNAGQSNYAFAKAGIASFGIVIAKEMSRYGVTSNVIAPRARTRLTEMTFGGAMNAPAEGFDQMDPDNIAPWVVYLCTEEAAHISGQVFMVFGGTVQFVEQYKLSDQIQKAAGRWTVEELVKKSADLFGDRQTSPQQRIPGVPSAR
jgi:NAD(P)-dependent dehydrogenase (short-subunit alcohol dehydrogenase family)